MAPGSAKAPREDFPEHFEVSGEAPERVAERRRAVFFHEEVPDPGKEIPGKEGQAETPPPKLGEAQDQHNQADGGAGKVKSPVQGVAVFIQIKGPEFREGLHGPNVISDGNDGQPYMQPGIFFVSAEISFTLLYFPPGMRTAQ